jgi:ankyrin repeat protein
MSKTALLDALHRMDVDRVREILRARPDLREFRDEKDYNLLQICCKRQTMNDPALAERQVRMAKWFVAEGFDPRMEYTTPPGEDDDDPAVNVSLAWLAVAKAQNTKLARYMLGQGANPEALYAAAWWGNADIIPDLVKHGGELNTHVGATPLHMAVGVFTRGTEGKPRVARQRRETLRVMLDLGADPNIPASDKMTPLHTALKKEYFEAFDMLLRHGADPDVSGPEGRTVREIASRKRDKRWIRRLEE